MAEPASPIVGSKVRLPAPLPGGVDRRRLLAHLTEGFERGAPAGLLCAPAGSGKTTLLRSFLAGLPSGRTAWFEADGYDNEPIRFWSHLSAGLQRAAAGSGDGYDAVPVSLARVGDWSRVVERLVASLEEAGQVWLVVDDYHSITSPMIHEHLDLLVRWLPPGARLILSARVDPPLPAINRLRLQGRLVELRATDLAFDTEEAGQLVARTTASQLTTDTAARLVERTEGWAAGLYLAALSIRGAGDPEAVVERFAGDERLVADYLRSEFLVRLDDDSRRFLLHTSVLDELNGELCDVVAEATDSALRLRDLERGSLLLIPLDDRDHWYRHHHLISQWLRSELALTERSLVPELHRRAAGWLAEAGRSEPAFRHARESGDAALAVELVERFWHAALMGGRYVTLRTWLDDLGPGVEQSASLCIARAKLARNTGEPATTAADWLDRAADLADPQDAATMAHLHTNQMVHERMIGDLGAAERHGRQALAAATDPALIPEARSVLGATLAQLGSFDEAVDNLTIAIEAGESAQDLLTDVFARAHLALPLYESGRHRRAQQVAMDAVHRAEATDLVDSPILGNARIVLGHLDIDEGRLDDAGEHLRWAAIAGERSRSTTTLFHALLGLARLEAASRHSIEARRLLAEARSVIEAMPDPGRLAGLVDAATRQYLGQGPDGALAGMGTDEPAGPLPLVEDLTERELAVLRLLPSDLALRDVGSELFVSHNTVKGHVKAIYRKLGVNTRADAVERSRQLGLL